MSAARHRNQRLGSAFHRWLAADVGPLSRIVSAGLDGRRQVLLGSKRASDLAPLRRGFFCGRTLCNQPPAAPLMQLGLSGSARIGVGQPNHPYPGARAGKPTLPLRRMPRRHSLGPSERRNRLQIMCIVWMFRTTTSLVNPAWSTKLISERCTSPGKGLQDVWGPLPFQHPRQSAPP